jgi:hypothetical protein
MLDGPAECRSYSNSTAAPALRCGGRGFFGALTKANESWGESGSRVKSRFSRRSQNVTKASARETRFHRLHSGDNFAETQTCRSASITF